ncbi:hypothetical protein DFJ58DRAFT_815530 [Suillus subalutaceus]|uniref:uncharacterized protein n=1 Tax=Suillus subalutaceus TaxID=48586 RepID=UPI001B864942|nr:uncharacterized protein DFJ58DRAFT_815530 [Suillus subalutaceus]KAG1837581.1 hypothetical protein DFJ58DRAFT_815530 [Suillus subalutaceus]
MSSLLSVSDITKLQTVKVSRGNICLFASVALITPQVRWTWFKPWDVPRIMFTISRYLPFAGVGMTAYDALRDSNQCASTVEGYIIHIICIVAAEGLLVIRTWAFWQKSKRLLIVLLVYIVLSVSGAIATDLIPTMLIPGGTCYFESTRNAAIVYMFLAMFDSVMLILTVYKRFHDYKDFRSEIIVTLYHDGIFYMLCILAVTLANVICEGALPSAYSNMFDTLQVVSHSVLASRILFRLRESNERVHAPSMSLTTLDSQIKYLRPSSMSMSGTGPTSEV